MAGPGMQDRGYWIFRWFRALVLMNELVEKKQEGRGRMIFPALFRV